METIKKAELDSFLVNYVPKRYLTQKEAVIYTGTSAGTINEWRNNGLRVIQLSPEGRWKYDIKDLDAWMEKHKL